MSWGAGDPVITDDVNSLAATIAERWEAYENHFGQDVELTYFYMSQADARLCVQVGSLTLATKVRSDTHPSEAPGSCIDKGYIWFIAIASGSSESYINVVSWGAAIREVDEDEDGEDEDDEDGEDDEDDEDEDGEDEDDEDEDEDGEDEDEDGEDEDDEDEDEDGGGEDGEE
ncbi:hypothetical protein AS026_26800 [Rhizobium altiplani]|uniref:Uncharacterized protein n=2 Tax=Rhizobium/Agrobacterium group TaxID=227290 RepID=A0A109J0N0_9HYPH|nr:hypothetical protein AS026_26800 [Rhizobium altiplani]